MDVETGIKDKDFPYKALVYDSSDGIDGRVSIDGLIKDRLYLCDLFWLTLVFPKFWEY